MLSFNERFEKYKIEYNKVEKEIQKVIEKICLEKDYEFVSLHEKYISINIPELKKFNKIRNGLEKLLIKIVFPMDYSLCFIFNINATDYRIYLKNNISSILYTILNEYINHIYLITKHYYEELELNSNFRGFSQKLKDSSYIRDLKI